jgi:phosphatidylinositol dimannoside acyltransferase
LQILLKFAELIIQNIPRKAGYFVFSLFGSLFLIFGKKRRETLRYNLKRAASTGFSEKMLKKTFTIYAKYYFDLFRDRKELLSHIEPEGDAYFKSHTIPAINGFLAQKRGCIFISTHSGNWDVAGSYAASLLPGKVNVVVEKLSPALYAWFTSTRTRFGMKVLDASDIKSMIRVLKSGEVLILLGDRDLDRLGYKMDFFGEKAFIPSGLSKLALMTDSAVFTGICTRTAKDEYRVMLSDDVLNTEKAERTDENLESLTKKIVSSMETLIRTDPAQWCMMQQVFVDQNTGSVKK